MMLEHAQISLHLYSQPLYLQLMPQISCTRQVFNRATAKSIEMFISESGKGSKQLAGVISREAKDDGIYSDQGLLSERQPVQAWQHGENAYTRSHV